MENINNTERLLKIIDDKLDAIKCNLKAYKAVDATLSRNTLLDVISLLEMTNIRLEKGFVKDACDEIEEIYKLN